MPLCCSLTNSSCLLHLPCPACRQPPPPRCCQRGQHNHDQHHQHHRHKNNNTHFSAVATCHRSPGALLFIAFLCVRFSVCYNRAMHMNCLACVLHKACLLLLLILLLLRLLLLLTTTSQVLLLLPRPNSCSHAARGITTRLDGAAVAQWRCQHEHSCLLRCIPSAVSTTAVTPPKTAAGAVWRQDPS